MIQDDRVITTVLLNRHEAKPNESIKGNPYEKQINNFSNKKKSRETAWKNNTKEKS